ncbi:copper chaperone PCu(A)C [Microbacterium sp. NPDC076768]|uniref:copper chaperone PCu(A)C n=1 Tax=Microbacterium sp. NPDC076768 TaxID=3154858 RepID=UPI00341ED197
MKGTAVNTSKTLPRLAAVIAVSLLALTGCSNETTPAEPEAVAASDVVTIEDAWVKSADEGMSATFGTLVNSGDEDVTVVSITSEASAMVEPHETVENDAGEMVMRKIDAGFIIPAGGELELAPGANHIMMMDLTGPLTAGSEVSLTLTFSDDSTYEFSAPVKDYAGAEENYEGGEEDMDMDMDQ